MIQMHPTITLSYQPTEWTASDGPGEGQRGGGESGEPAVTLAAGCVIKRVWNCRKGE